MTAILALALAQSGPTEVPPGILFGFGRVFAFHARAAELCSRSERDVTDKEYDEIRKRLIARYGANAFNPRKPAPAGPGDCHVVMMVYRTNLAEYRKQVDAAFTSASPAQ